VRSGLGDRRQGRADGYTLVVSGVASHCIAPALSKIFRSTRYATSRTSRSSAARRLLVVNPRFRQESQEFIAYAKAEGASSLRLAGNGTQGHLIAEQLKQVRHRDDARSLQGREPRRVRFIAGHVT